MNRFKELVIHIQWNIIQSQRMSEILPLVVIGMDIKDTLLSEISQKQILYVSIYIWNPKITPHIIYIYVYVCMCICVYVYICVCIYVCVHVCIYVYTHAYIHTYVCIYVYISKLIDTENMFVAAKGRGGRWVI